MIPPCLTLCIIRYISRVKWSNPVKGVAPSSTPQCSSYLKRSLWVTLNYVGAGLGAGPQVQGDPSLASERVLWLCILLLLNPLFPRPEPAGLLCLVIRREHHQHDLPQHQSQPDRCHLPSIRWAIAGACGKGMLPVPDPYWGGDWGWRWLHWTDFSSNT